MKKHAFCAAAFVFMLAFAFGVQAVTILIDPATQDSPPAGGTLTVGVKVEDVTGLFAYQFELLFDNTALKLSAIQEREFLGSDGTATFPFLTLDVRMVGFQDITPDVALDVNSAGAIMIANTRLGSTAGIHGAGILVTICF